MDRKNFQYIEMFTRVVEFGQTHQDLFPKDSLAGKTFAQFGAALSKVSEHAGGQVASHNAVLARTRAREAAHEALREQLQRITDTARAISLDRPGIEGQFRMPARSRDRALILGAKAFAEAAAPLSEDFVQHNLPENFIQELEAAAARLEASIQEQGASRTRRANAGAGIGDNLGQCARLMKRLDAIVKNTVKDDLPLLAEWQATRRMPRSSNHTADPPAETPSSPA
jgi:hypothetical protein